MKVLPFKIPKQKNEALVYQEDNTTYLYDKFHQHQEIQISLVIKGEGTFVLGGFCYTLQTKRYTCNWK